MITLLTLAIAVTQGASSPVTLKRTFVKGEKSEYSVDANLNIDARSGMLATFLPEEAEFKYTFYVNTTDVNAGIATVRYFRPSITEIAGSTTDSDPVPKTETLDMTALLQVSPINEILDAKDLTPKKKKKADDSGGDSRRALLARGNGFQEGVAEFIGPFIGDLERLSVFIGGAEGSLDLEPKLNLDAVKVGDTWKRTVSYQPQKLSSKAGKTVVQRLDLTYTYGGVVQSRGKSVQRIHGSLKLDTDLGTYVNDLFNAKPENTGLKSIPTKMDIQMDFDLDPKSLQTVYAKVKSEGSFKIFATVAPSAIAEQNIHGTSVMKLISVKNVLQQPSKH